MSDNTKDDKTTNGTFSCRCKNCGHYDAGSGKCKEGKKEKEKLPDDTCNYWKLDLRDYPIKPVIREW